MNLNNSKVWGKTISVSETVLVNENLRFDQPLKDGEWSTEVIIWLLIWLTLFVGFALATCYIGNTWNDTITVQRENQRRGKHHRRGRQDIFMVSCDTKESDNKTKANSGHIPLDHERIWI